MILNEEKWQRRHWRSILSSYNGSPWFFYFADSMAGLYEKRFDFLIDWNLSCLDWLYQKLKLPVNYSISDRDPQAEEMREIDPDRVDVEAPITYPQVYQEKTGFIPHLSVIDLLFCTGPSQTIQLGRQP
jgi:hypothetical protein